MDMTGYASIGVVAFLLATLLLAPIRLSFTYSERRFRAWLSYMGIRHEFARAESRGAGDSPPRDASILSDLEQVVSAIWENRAVIRKLWRLGGRLVRRNLKVWRLESGMVHVRYGTGDPGTTGMLTGGLHAASGAIRAHWPQVGISLTPAFSEIALAIDARITLTCRLVEPLWQLALIAAGAPWRGIRRLRRQLLTHKGD